jgi:hypothetical protein
VLALLVSQPCRAAAAALPAAFFCAAAAVVLPQLQVLQLFMCQLSVQLLPQLLSAAGLTKFECMGLEYIPSADDVGRRLSQQQMFSVVWQGLGRLPKLCHLFLSGPRSLTSADISPLSTLQHLQHLYLADGGHRLMHHESVPNSGPKALLSALQHLTQLRHLSLFGCAFCSTQPQQQGDTYQCFSALTASTQLTALMLSEYRAQLVPQAAFAAGVSCRARAATHEGVTPFRVGRSLAALCGGSTGC